MPRTVFLGIDFFDLLGGPAAGSRDTLNADAAPRFDPRVFEEEVLSVIDLQDSIEPLSIQRARHPDVLTELGFNPPDNDVAEVEQRGTRTLFRQKAQDNIVNWRRQAPLIRPAKGGMSDSEQAVDQFDSRARPSHTKVYPMIYPYHAEARVIVERLGPEGGCARSGKCRWSNWQAGMRIQEPRSKYGISADCPRKRWSRFLRQAIAICTALVLGGRPLQAGAERAGDGPHAGRVQRIRHPPRQRQRR